MPGTPSPPSIPLKPFPDTRVQQQEWARSLTALLNTYEVSHFFRPITQLPAEMVEPDPDIPQVEGQPQAMRLRTLFPNVQPNMPLGNEGQRAIANMVQNKYTAQTDSSYHPDKHLQRAPRPRQDEHCPDLRSGV